MKDPNINRRLGPYQLKSVLGRGGMGTVYAAEDEEGNSAAVKLLSPVLATDASFRERFNSEIESLKKLRHPNIVELFAYGEQEGQLYYAMERIQGTNLQEELHQGRRFTWREVTRIAIEICAALKHAHDHGVIHRDLKPANLLYNDEETTKLLDFGIAKLFGNTGITTGNVMGTADYMAPEQAEGKSVGPRTDLYSLGSVMYALLSGRPPFLGKSVPEVVHKVRFEPPIPVGRMANDVPDEMERVIEQLLEKNPSKRIPTALAVSHRLKAMEHALSIRERTDITTSDISSTSEPVTPADRTNAGLSRQKTVRLEKSNTTDADDVVVITQDEPTTGPDRFTRVDPLQPATASPRAVPWESIGSIGVLVGLILAGAWFVRASLTPDSADQLYQRITAAQQDDNERAVLNVAADVDVFLEHYADDPRSSELAALQTDIQLLRRQRQLELKSRRRHSIAKSPLENVYLDIIRKLPIDRLAARRQLQALVDLEASLVDDAPSLEIVELAKKQIQRLDEDVDDAGAMHAPFVAERLKRAKEIAKSDPQAAQKIIDGLRQLYGHQPWAAELFEQP